MLNVENMSRKILDILVDHMNYLRKHPEHLAWVMMNYYLVADLSSMQIIIKKEQVETKEGALYVVRDVESEDLVQPTFVFIDPSDETFTPIQEMYKRLNSEKDKNLAFAAADLMDEGFGKFTDSDPNNFLQNKPNKRLEEWIELLTTTGDITYITYSKEDALRHLLTQGDWFKWNKEGYLIGVGRSGLEQRLFYGYTRAENEIPENIRLKVLEIRNDPLIVKYTSKLLEKYESERQRLYNGETYEQVFFPERTKREIERKEALIKLTKRLKRFQQELGQDIPRYEIRPKKEKEPPIKIYSDSNFVNIPANAHDSYVLACHKIAQKVIKDKRTEQDSGKRAAEFLLKMNGQYFNAA